MNLSCFQLQLSHVRGRVSAGVSFGQIAESSLNMLELPSLPMVRFIQFHISELAAD